MKRRPKGLIERFYSAVQADKQTVFQLIRDEDGTYYIKRDSLTLIMGQKEETARKGFKSLRSKWAV